MLMVFMLAACGERTAPAPPPMDAQAARLEPVRRMMAPTDVPDLKDARRLDPATIFRSVTATSVLPDPAWGPDGYAAWRLFDGDPELGWCAGRRALGIGEEIGIEFLHPVSLNGLTLTYPETFSGTGGPKVAEIEMVNDQNEARLIQFIPGETVSEAKFVPVSGRRFRLVIRKVAARGDATLCIGEAALTGRSDVLAGHFPAESEAVAQAEVRQIFDELESYRQPQIAQPKLSRALAGYFSRWIGPGELAAAQLLFDHEFRTVTDMKLSGDNLCAVAVRAVTETSGIAERLFRQRYLAGRSVKLLDSCGGSPDLAYWVIKQNRLAVLLFHARGDRFGALEAGDLRALPKLLEAYRTQTMIGWWRQPVRGYEARGRSMEELVRLLPREPVRRVLDGLILLEEGHTLYSDGLRELRRMLGP